MISELISAMTQVFKQSSDKPGSSDSISRNVALKQPKAYSLGQDFKVWRSQFDEYSKLPNIPESKKKAFLVPDADYRFKEEIANDRFLEGDRCSDGCREQPPFEW